MLKWVFAWDRNSVLKTWADLFVVYECCLLGDATNDNNVASSESCVDSAAEARA
jgi:hypothetical protein